MTPLAFLHAPAGVAPLEVRCAHPVRLAPATHSQGHGRPCLQRPHPRRGFSATWSFRIVHFRLSFPVFIFRVPSTRRVTVCLISEQVGRMVF